MFVRFAGNAVDLVLGRLGGPPLGQTHRSACARGARVQRPVPEALADAAALDRSYMSGIERGVRNVSVWKLAAVAKALRVRLRNIVPD